MNFEEECTFKKILTRLRWILAASRGISIVSCGISRGGTEAQ